MSYLAKVTITMLDGNEYTSKERCTDKHASSPMGAINHVYASIMDNYGLKYDQVSDIKSEVTVLCS